MVRFVKLHPDARVTRGSQHSVGFDVVCTEFQTLDPGESKLFPVGIAMEMPESLECQIRPRSGLATKQHLIIPNAPGTIDPDYRGEVKVCLMNIGEKVAHIDKGQRIAQLVFNEVHIPEIQYVKELSETVRGKGGFGSTGK